jgi:hypothetical protein
VAALGALLASATSALVTLPLVARIGKTPSLTRRVVRAIAGSLVLGGVGVLAQFVWRR